jgi:uncharacterized repeat protein (TIGR01451 family)
MKKVSLLTSASLTSLMAIGLVAAPAYAWHPKGVIVKKVQNQTAGSAISDANTKETAVSAAPGDTLVYTITISNTGAPAANNDDDMAATKLSDTLPTGIELVSNPTQRTITEDLGTITPGNSVTKTYAVKVTDTTDGDVITNKACFTGDSIVNDNPQSGCDVAIVTVKVPPVTPPTTPTPPVTPPVGGSGATTLPNTGNSALTASLLVGLAAIVGYAVNTLRLKLRSDS